MRWCVRTLSQLIHELKARIYLWWRTRFILWKVQSEYRSASELRRLIIRHVHAVDGINEREFRLALRLNSTAPETKELCTVCRTGRLTVGDTEKCRKCNKYILENYHMGVNVGTAILV